MMKHTTIILSIIFSIALNACNKFGSSKVAQLIDFTPTLTSDPTSNDINIKLSNPLPAHNWPSFINAVNEQPNNIKLNSTFSKFNKINLSNNYNKSPIIVDNKMFILDNQNVVTAYSLNNYIKLWSVNLFTNKKFNKELVGGVLSYSDGKLAVTNGSRDVFIINATDGTKIVQKTVDDIIKTQPIIYNNTLIVLTISNSLYAIDMTSGNILWQHEALPETISSGKSTAPILFKDKIIVSYSSGSVYLINAKTGEQEWGLNLAAENIDLLGFAAQNVEVQPIIFNNFLYIASNNGYLHKISLTNGEVIWRQAIQDIKALTYSGNMLFIINNAKQVAAISTDNGKVKWVSSLRSENNGKNVKTVSFSNLIMINDQLIFATSDGHLYMIDALTGNIVKTITISQNISALFVVGEQFFMFGNNNFLNVGVK